MAFHSAAFLFFFLPLVFLLYLVIPGTRAKNVYLTFAGLIFYACGQWRGLPFLLFSALLAWLAGRSGRKGVLVLTLACQLVLLGAFKYLDFFTGTLNDLLGLRIPAANLPVPIGVSFFTFKAMAYTIDAYRDGGKSRRFLDVLLYLSFFPQVVSGPIARYEQFAENLEDRPLNAVQTAHGLRRFITGFAKKALLSETAALAANSAFGLEAGLDFRLAWLGAFAYTIQIYFDFSGYSDMAVGLCRVFGFHLPENFHYPFISASITEFWRRWHISLGRWFRDYVYIPLGGNRKGRGRQMLNILVVWVLTGFWHGAAWNFILWGLLFAILLAAEKFWLLNKLEKSRVLSRVYTLFFVLLSFVIFSAENAGQALYNLGGLFGAGGIPFVSDEAVYSLQSFGIVLLAGITGATPTVRILAEKLSERPAGGRIIRGFEPFVFAALVIVITAYLVDGSFHPFLYFRF